MTTTRQKGRSGGGARHESSISPFGASLARHLIQRARRRGYTSNLLTFLWTSFRNLLASSLDSPVKRKMWGSQAGIRSLEAAVWMSVVCRQPPVTESQIQCHAAHPAMAAR
jgi:hypothetical protein